MMSLDTNRTTLLEMLSEYARRWPSEHLVVDAFIAFVTSTERCFFRDYPSGHITASAWVVDPTASQVLLLHHAKLRKWMQPGGHADGNPVVIDVARQEVLEETGVDALDLAVDGIFDLDIHPIPARGSDGEHLHYDVRFAFRTPTTVLIGNHESTDIAWIPLHNLTSVTSEPSILRMATKWNQVSAVTNAPSSLTRP